MVYIISKKIIWLALMIGLIIAPTMACKVIDFYNQNNSYVNDDICIDIEKISTRRFKFNLVEKNSSISELKCMILIWNNNLLQDVWACNQEFVYEGQDQSRIKIYARLGTWLWWNSEWYYDFVDWKWTTYNYDDYNQNDYDSTKLDNFYIASTENSDWRYDVYIKARDDANSTFDDYDWTVKFKVYKRTSSTSSWTQITSYTSDYYTLSTSYYNFTTSDYWDKDLYDFIKFNNFDYDYKLEVYDEDYTSKKWEKIFYVKNTNNNYGNLNNFYLSSYPTSPSINSRIDLTIKARNSNNTVVADYDWTIRFKIYKRAYNSSTFYEITSSSSSYYTINRSSYTFDSNNNWEVTLSDVIKFTNNNYDYKIRVYDYNNNSLYGEKMFYFVDDEGDNNYSDWFSTYEISKIQKVYNVRNTVINNLKNKYSSLRNSSTRKNLSDDFYQNMEYVLESNSNWEFDNYDDFLNWFMERYSYTIDRM